MPPPRAGVINSSSQSALSAALQHLLGSAHVFWYCAWPPSAVWVVTLDIRALAATEGGSNDSSWQSALSAALQNLLGSVHVFWYCEWR